MKKLVVTIKGMNNSKGTATLNGIEYEMKELQSKWQLVAHQGSAKMVFEWRKKDYATFDEWRQFLVDSGYVIKLAD